jgi:PPP family 3-phenylpropionic acid transporter
MSMARPAGALPLGGYYVLYFGTIGVTLPFLPAYFRSLELSGTQIGVLLALQPAMTLVAPPLWGQLADRTGRTDRMLALVSLGALAGFIPLTQVRTFPLLLLAMAGYAFFASSITTLVDSLALHRVSVVGGSYARLRLFGSLGFVLSTSAFGLAVEEVDVRAVWAALGLVAAYAAWSWTLRAKAAPAPRRGLLSGWALLRHRDLALVLAAAALHWIACAPFHGIFGIHVVALGLAPWVIGLSAGVGVVAEIAVMYAYPQVARRIAPRHVLLVAFAASAGRWAGMAVAESPEAIIALSVLHGLSFGAFFVAAVAFVARRVPASQRAAGQALLVSVTFGLGGLAGYLAAGAGYEALGGHRLFAVAAGMELLPALLILGVRGPEATRVDP